MAISIGPWTFISRCWSSPLLWATILGAVHLLFFYDGFHFFKDAKRAKVLLVLDVPGISEG